jgi:hypothetical protein
MTRYTILVITLLAALALAATSALGGEEESPPAEHVFHSHKDKTDISGWSTDEHVFGFKGANVEVKCKKLFLLVSGTIKAKTTSEVRVHPEYEVSGIKGCTANGVTATVTTTGCDYVFHGETLSAYHGKTQISCEGTKVITITASGCTIHLPPQTAGLGSKYTNEQTSVTTSEWALIVQSTAQEMTYTATHSVACTLAGVKAGTFGDGTYTGKTILWGYDDTIPATSQTGIWVTKKP